MFTKVEGLIVTTLKQEVLFPETYKFLQIRIVCESISIIIDKMNK